MLGEEALGVLAALADPLLTVGEPGAAPVDQVGRHGEVEQVALLRDALAVHDVELRLPEGRRDLVLHHPHAAAVAQNLASLLDGGEPPDVEADRGVELERVSAGGRLGVSEHHPDLMADLVDEDDARPALGDDAGELAERLAHEAGLEAHVGVAHLAVDLRLGDEGRHRIDYGDVEGAAPDQGLYDLEGLLARVGLADDKLVHLDP